ncbi:MAG TPA: DUF1697 domain-containing protein [Roseivirga sp.]
MTTWIALLRGINVGGNHIVPMKELKALMENNGFQNVRTYIQSGNVVCDYPTPPNTEIGDLIESRFGFNPSTFILSAQQLKHTANCNPFPKDIGKAVHFFFLESLPDQIDYALLESLKSESEAYRLIDNVFYVYAPDGIGKSKMVDKIGKAFSKTNMTARNLNTINKLLQMTE